MLDSGAEKRCHFLLVFGWAVTKAHSHTPKANRRHLKMAFSKVTFLHGSPLANRFIRRKPLTTNTKGPEGFCWRSHCFRILWRGQRLRGDMARPAMKLVSLRAARSPGPRLALALEMEIERHCSSDQILQGRFIDLFAFVDVDGAPHIPIEAGVEQT